MPQIVWKLKSHIDFARALPDKLISETDNTQLSKMQDTGEFFIYLYKESKSNDRKAISVKINENDANDYAHYIDKSLIDVNVFDFEQLKDNTPRDQVKYFDWIKLNKEDFYISYDENTSDTFTVRVFFDSLLKHLATSRNEVYEKMFKDFNVKYFNEKMPERENNQTKRIKI